MFEQLAVHRSCLAVAAVAAVVAELAGLAVSGSRALQARRATTTSAAAAGVRPQPLFSVT